MAEMAVQPATSEVERLSRKSIPMPREMGFWAVAVFAFSSIGLGYSGLLPFSTFAGMWPGVDLAGTVAVGGLLALLSAYIFAVIGTVAPHYGADYVVASRVISPPLAFASSFALVIFFSLMAGMILAEIPQTLIPMFAQTHTLLANEKSLVNIMDWAITPTGVVTVGTIGVVLVYVLLILPPRASRWFILTGASVVVLAWGAICYLLATSPLGQFQVSWNQYIGVGSFQEQLNQARSLGMSVLTDKRTFLVVGWMLGLWIFSGFNNPTYFAREVKNPKRNLLMGSLLALLVSLIILGGATLMLQRQVSPEWLAAESFLGQTDRYQGTAMPWLPLYAAILRPNILMVYILGLCWVFSLVNLALNTLYTASRIILAWGEDRLVPRIVAYIHPELHSPIISVLIVCFLAEMSVLEAGLNLNIINQINPVYIIIITQFLPILGITLLPFLKRDWFMKAPGLVRFKLGPVPLISILGLLTLLSLLGILIAFIRTPAFTLYSQNTLINSVFPIIVGLAWFYWRRNNLRKEHTENIDQVFKKLPEE